MKKLSICIIALCLYASVASASTVSLKLSGEGAANDSTITAGKKVSVDIYIENEGTYRGMTLGFKISSDKIKKVVHPNDKGKGINTNGDIKGHNGFQDDSIWDMLGGLTVATTDWDGNLPDLLGFGAVSKSKGYTPHKLEKKMSFDLVINETGTIVIDSAFYAPSGRWLFAPPGTTPKWGGPYKFHVIK